MRRSILIVLLAFAVLPYFVGLDDSAIWDANEAFYVETPRQMIERGDYVNPSFNDQPRFNKPPLSYWIVAAFYRAFGVSVSVERLAIALGALVLVLTTLVIGRVAYSTEAGLLAALVLASAPRVVMFSRRIFIDVYITMFMGLTLLFFLLAEQRPAQRRRYLVLMYVSMALGFMTKGPVAIVLPGLVVLLAYGMQGRLRDLRGLMLPTGALIVAAVALPWYVALYAEHGWVYIRRFFIDENLARYAAPYGAAAGRRGPLFYVPVLLTDLFPWSFFLPAALYAAVRDVWPGTTGASERKVSRGLVGELLAWVVVIVGFFTLSQTKQDLYIFPIVPAEAAIVGGFLAAGIARRPGARAGLAQWMCVLAGALVAITGAGVLLLFGSPARVYAIQGAAVVGWSGVAGGLAAAGFAARQRLFSSVMALGAVAVAINWILVLAALPSFRQYQPVPAMSDRIRAEATADAQVAYYRTALPSLVYYLHRPVLELFEPDELIAAFGRGDVYCLLTSKDYDEVRDRLPRPTCVLERRPFFDVKIGNVIKLNPLPELLLVSNRCGTVDSRPSSVDSRHAQSAVAVVSRR
jgi:4-amino-4-deoxy-L-arabinose transferase-like glycosyltransferase